jgi:hypothetical protein
MYSIILKILKNLYFEMKKIFLNTYKYISKKLLKEKQFHSDLPVFIRKHKKTIPKVPPQLFSLRYLNAF